MGIQNNLKIHVYHLTLPGNFNGLARDFFAGEILVQEVLWVLFEVLGILFFFFPFNHPCLLNCRSTPPPAPHWAEHIHTLDNFKTVKKSKRFRFLTDLVTVELKFNIPQSFSGIEQRRSINNFCLN